MRLVKFVEDAHKITIKLKGLYGNCMGVVHKFNMPHSPIQHSPETVLGTVEEMTEILIYFNHIRILREKCRTTIAI